MFTVDYKSGLPIFEQIYRSVIKLGAAGAFGETGQLPSVRAVAKGLGVNPNTVQKAYAMLERDGVIYSVPGKGSFLAKPEAVWEKRRAEALARVQEAVREALECGVEYGALQAALEDSRKKEETT
ncbi:GntR family transcriptional regulator [Acutalibacter caecimuris]|uniref:GntR family transcriptional regulator n=1 Tax=Acutalibacter caecimuris TaxID=3093657 RepID=UPI002AC965BF|nr:GntR family transcriptional regulator [Acutalibacter sp. M00118]